MKRVTSATVCSNDASIPRDRARSSADVNRWVAMIDAELRSEEDVTDIDQSAVTVALEFGRGTVDLASQPLQAGDSLRLDQLADEPLDLVVDGRPIARGELVVVDGQFGVRIVELLMSVAAWFLLSISPSVAEERPRERPASILFDDADERLETPFGIVRGSRTILETENSSDTSTRLGDEPSKPVATPLPRRPDTAIRDANRAHVGNSTSWSATIWPLLFVVGLIIVGARWLKSRSPSTARGLPADVFEVLGHKTIDARTSVMLARCGSKLLVLSQSPHGLQTLAEITDPVEIDCLAGLCRATQRDQSLVNTFRSLLHKPNATKPTTTLLAKNATPNDLDEQLAARLMTVRSSPSTSRSEVR